MCMKTIFLLNFTWIIFNYTGIAQSPCTNHPLFNILPQHSISSCDEKEFDKVMLYYYDKNGDYVELEKSGYLLKTSYSFDGDFEKRPSNAMIFQNYIRAVKDKGGELINESKSKAILNLKSAGETWWVVVESDQSGTYYLTTIREVSMNQYIVLTAEEISREIATTGKAAFYGIYFETDKADIKPESRTTISEMAKFLQAHPNLKVYIVGHTDNIGSFEHNLQLSQKRAAAVVQELTSTHSISADRLKAHGVSALSPVSTNQTEDGKSKNRRVEMVAQ